MDFPGVQLEFHRLRNTMDPFFTMSDNELCSMLGGKTRGELLQLRYPDNVLLCLLFHHQTAYTKTNYSLNTFDTIVGVATMAPELILEHGSRNALNFAARNYDLLFREFFNILKDGNDMEEVCHKVLYESDYGIPSANVLEMLLRGGAKVNGENSAGQTPLVMSLMHHCTLDVDTVNTLLKFKADPNLPTRDHVTPLECVLKAAKLETNSLSKIVSSLLQAGAKVWC